MRLLGISIISRLWVRPPRRAQFPASKGPRLAFCCRSLILSFPVALLPDEVLRETYNTTNETGFPFLTCHFGLVEIIHPSLALIEIAFMIRRLRRLSSPRQSTGPVINRHSGMFQPPTVRRSDQKCHGDLSLHAVCGITPEHPIPSPILALPISRS